jgi:hypothetical protein
VGNHRQGLLAVVCCPLFSPSSYCYNYYHYFLLPPRTRSLSLALSLSRSLALSLSRSLALSLSLSLYLSIYHISLSLSCSRSRSHTLSRSLSRRLETCWAGPPPRRWTTCARTRGAGSQRTQWGCRQSSVQVARVNEQAHRRTSM